MGSNKTALSSKAALPFKTNNKEKRQQFYVKQKKARENVRRDERFRRKREEAKDPSLKEDRLRRNVPMTIDRKRQWDEVEGDVGAGLGLAIDASRLKRRKADEEEAQKSKEEDGKSSSAEESEDQGSDEEEDDEDNDSMLDFSDEDEDEDEEDEDDKSSRARKSQAKSKSKSEEEEDKPSEPTSTSTKLDTAPEALTSKFPTLFTEGPPPTPKILITTSINSTLHKEADLLTTLFPNAVYIPRSAHRYGHKFSIKEIAKFASNRNFTSVFVLKEDQKKPTGLSVVHLPHGPTFHFSISNWIEGKKLPGHGRATDHAPELILNNFRTPLGILTAQLFRTLFVPQPELIGRQVVTMHNQRDYIFVRRHRYVFREKRATEKAVVGADGKEMKGAEGIRTGLQELGPRFTLKLRRVDKTIQRGTEGVEWEWKAKMERSRTKFQL